MESKILVLQSLVGLKMFKKNKYTEALRLNTKGRIKYEYEHPRTGEVFLYSRKGPHKKGGVTLIYKGKAKNG
jgi:hypothetical protein